MAHPIHDRRKLLDRIRRFRGQVEAIERAIDGKAPCADAMHLLASTRAALRGLMSEVVEHHLRSGLADAEKHPAALAEAAAEHLLEVVRAYLR